MIRVCLPDATVGRLDEAFRTAPDIQLRHRL